MTFNFELLIPKTINMYTTFLCCFFSIFNGLCRRVQHPNILCLMGTIVQGGSLMVITNLVRGKDLHALLFSSDAKQVIM